MKKLFKSNILTKTPLLDTYCKRNHHDHSQFYEFEELAEQCLCAQKEKKIKLKSIVYFREVLTWHIPADLRKLALNCIIRGESLISKSSVVSEYGHNGLNSCPWFFLVDNPHYKTAAPMQLYFPTLIEALGVFKKKNNVRVPRDENIKRPVKKKSQPELVREHIQQTEENIKNQFDESFSLERWLNTSNKITRERLEVVCSHLAFKSLNNVCKPHDLAVRPAQNVITFAVRKHNKPFIFKNFDEKKSCEIKFFGNN